MRQSQSNQSNRREFLQQSAAFAGTSLLAGLGAATPTPALAGAASQGPIGLVFDPADPLASSGPGQFGFNHVGLKLELRGVATQVHQSLERAAGLGLVIVATGEQTPLAREALRSANLTLPDVRESFALVPFVRNGQSLLLGIARDGLGLAYALTELADRIEYASNVRDSLGAITPTVEKPANAVRSAMRQFVSDVEDKSWFNDRDWWTGYLTMLVQQRFNRINFSVGLGYDFAQNMLDTYFYFAYPFLLDVPGYKVRARGLPDAERDANLRMLKFISDSAAERGLHFQLGLWTHTYQWTNSPRVNYVIDGLSAENHAAYCHDAIRTLLQACPSIKGVTIRTHGESGVAEGNYDFWKTIFGGVAEAGRKLEIDLHAKGLDQQMIDRALDTGLPVNITPKFWAEHMGLPYHQAAIRQNEMPRRDAGGLMALSTGTRNHTRYGYADFMGENRRYGVINRIWPGTQRLLLWGDPAFAAEYSRACGFCGMEGGEFMEPLSFKGRKGSGLPGGRDGYADDSIRARAADWEKYRYTYRLWGRMLYNPDAAPEVWRRQLQAELGGAAEPAEAALAKSSRILPLVTTAHCPSAANNNYWPEVYANMSIVDSSNPGSYSDTPTPRVFGAVSPLDPQLFATVNEWAAALLSGQIPAKFSPLEVAAQLESWAAGSAADLAEAEKRAGAGPSAACKRLTVDVAITNGLGRFFAAKLRAGVLFALFDRSGQDSAKQAALQAYRQARAAWAELAGKAEGVYRTDITFGFDSHLRGNWGSRLAAIDKDIAAMEVREARSLQTGLAASAVTKAMEAVQAKPQRLAARVEHAPAASFKPGQAIAVNLRLLEGGIDMAWLWYRRVNQAEVWQSATMQKTSAGYDATVPAEYTNSPYPLQYYFELRDPGGTLQLYPGFRPDFLGQPYFVVRAA